MSDVNGVTPPLGRPAPKMCPLLTAAIMSRPPAALLGPDGRKQEPEAFACQGQSCMLYVPIGDQQGRIVGGQCAPALLPKAIGSIEQMIAIVGGVLKPAPQPPQKETAQ